MATRGGAAPAGAAAGVPGAHSGPEDAATARKRRKEAIRAQFFSAPLAANRYRAERVIGEGAYGVVVCARDSVTGERVAVKRIAKCLNNTPFATRILRELKFLRLLSRHENIVSTRDVLLPGELDRFNDAFVVFELMPTDLEHVMHPQQHVLRPDHIKYFMWQLLRGVHFMHASRVLHRDLKPNNILINAKCELRICDLGLARADFVDGPDTLFWTDYVATRWYRAPELVIEGSAHYSTAIDIWSCGCIFAEMLSGGKVLFPGKNALNQIELITDVFGALPANPFANMMNPYAKRKLQRFQNASLVPRRPLAQLFAHIDPSALDVLTRMLALDPDQRISALDALNHPYFIDYRRLGLGQIATPLPAAEFEFERLQLNTAQMRHEFLKEILHYHPDVDMKRLMQIGIGRAVANESAVDSFGRQLRNIRAGGERLQSQTLQERVLGLISDSDPRRAAAYAAASRQTVTMSEAEMGHFNGQR